MKRICSAAALALAAAFAAPASAQRVATASPEATSTTRGPSEEQLLGRWLSGSREIQAWKASVGAVRFDEITAQLLPNPQLGVDFVKLLDGKAPDGKFGVDARLEVPLPIFGQIGSRKAAARRNLEAAEVQLLVQLWDRAGVLAALMVERAFQNRRLEFAERSLAELERMERVVQKRTAAGANGPYDLLRVRIARGERSAGRDSARIARDQAESRLLSTIADPSLGSAPITREGLRAFAGPEDEEALVRTALQRRPDLMYARRAATASRAAGNAAAKGARPVPLVNASPYYVGGPYGFQLTFGLSMPLALFDRNQGVIGRANEEARSNDLTAEVLVERIKAEVRGAFRARRDAGAALSSYRNDTMATAEQLLSRAEVTYEAGVFTIAELFDAYETLWRAREQQLDLERQWADAEVALEQAAVLVQLPRPESSDKP